MHALRPEHAADSFTADGWFRTGDLASADPEGFLSIRGRSKDIVLRGGENISVTEIEGLLFEHPASAWSWSPNCPKRSRARFRSSCYVRRSGVSSTPSASCSSSGPLGFRTWNG
jgi:acyl-CoA synthetase (AMP-forming)/AMP-acid ligase II